MVTTFQFQALKTLCHRDTAILVSPSQRTKGEELPSANPDSSPVEERNPERKGMRNGADYVYTCSVQCVVLLRPDQPPCIYVFCLNLLIIIILAAGNNVNSYVARRELEFKTCGKSSYEIGDSLVLFYNIFNIFIVYYICLFRNAHMAKWKGSQLIIGKSMVRIHLWAP